MFVNQEILQLFKGESNLINKSLKLYKNQRRSVMLENHFSNPLKKKHICQRNNKTTMEDDTCKLEDYMCKLELDGDFFKEHSHQLLCC